MHAGGGVYTYLCVCGNISSCVSVRNPRCACEHIQGKATRLKESRLWVFLHTLFLSAYLVVPRKSLSLWSAREIQQNMPHGVNLISAHQCRCTYAATLTHLLVDRKTCTHVHVEKWIDTPGAYTHTQTFRQESAEGNRIAKLPVLLLLCWFLNFIRPHEKSRLVQPQVAEQHSCALTSIYMHKRSLKHTYRHTCACFCREKHRSFHTH